MEPVLVEAAVEPEAPPPVAEERPVPEVEASAAIAAVDTEIVVEASEIVEEATIVDVPFALPVAAPPAPAAYPPKRALVTVVSRLLSTLIRWAGVR
jgi:hypothetical protein